MNARLKALVDRQIVAPDHLWMIGVPLDEVLDPRPNADHPRSTVDDPLTAECRCPDACGRDHPNE